MRTLGNALMLTAVALAVVCTSARAQAPAGRVGFIDVQRVLVRSAAGVAAREQLEREKTVMQQKMDGKRKELEKKEQQLLQRVLQDLSGVIEKVGKERGFHLIVEKRGGAVLYGAPEADLTDEIIRAYDQQNTGKEKK